MKALSLWPPWSDFVAMGVKSLETRSWSTRHRGDLAIVSTRHLPPELGVGRAGSPRTGEHWSDRIGGYKVRRVVRRGAGGRVVQDDTTIVTLPITAPLWERPVAFGCVLAVATLVDVVPMVEWRDADNVVGREVNRGDGWLFPIDDHQWLDQNKARLKIDRRPRDGHVLELQGIPRDGYCRDVTHQLPYGDFAPGRYAWVLENIRPLARPVAAKGRQGLWDLDDATEEAVHAQLAAAAMMAP